METVVADTCALVSLAIPKADATYDTTSEPDPLQFLLTDCEVTVPIQVKNELQEMAGYDDIHAAAATNILAASKHFAVSEPLTFDDTPDSLPAYGLDEGETAAIVLANALDSDGLLTDEFNSLARIHAVVDDVPAVPTPRLLREYASEGPLTSTEAHKLIETIEPHRSWAENSYVQKIKQTL